MFEFSYFLLHRFVIVEMNKLLEAGANGRSTVLHSSHNLFISKLLKYDSWSQ